VEQRHDRLPAGAQHLDERRRRDQPCCASPPRARIDIAGRRVPEQPVAADEPRLLVDQHERAVGQPFQARLVVALGAAVREPLPVQARVDDVRPGLARVPLGPEVAEAHIVLAPAERAGPVPGGEGGRLVEEEQLGEPPRLEERRAVPAAELQAARDPAPPGVAPADPALVVVETTTIAVDEPAGRIGDELRERRDPVSKRHRGTVAD
jgi:hypothetical protein